MSTEGESEGLPAKIPDLDFRELDQALGSSRSSLGATSQPFRLVKEIGRRCEPPLTDPVTLKVGPNDRILVLDQLSEEEYCVVRFNAAGDCDGEAVKIPRSPREGLQRPTSMSLNAAGEMYFSDADLEAVVKFSSDGRWLESWRTAGIDGGTFHAPRDVDVDSADRLYVADSFNDRVVRLAPNGDLETQWSEFSNPLTGEEDDSLYEPGSVCVAADGTLYVADTNNQRVLAFQHEELVAQWSGAGLFELPSEVRLSHDGRTLYIADRNNLRVRRFRVGTGMQGKDSCTGLISLLRDGSDDSVSGGGDIDVLAAGFVTLVNPRRRAVVVLDFLEDTP